MLCQLRPSRGRTEYIDHAGTGEHLSFVTTKTQPMECVACKCDLGNSTPPMLLTCGAPHVIRRMSSSTQTQILIGHLCCEACLRPEESFQCLSCHQVAIVATRLFVTVGDTSEESVHNDEVAEHIVGLQGPAAEVRLDLNLASSTISSSLVSRLA